ncbi:MAG: ParA family protein, partial [Leptolyngbya sp. SIO4C1]|nr:ParA family protein [Leptolyngbya sp. SIO4C1]
MSLIITFYSFKGGVGRTMALANMAVLIAQMGYKVLMVDWDLEAPGLPRYFANYEMSNGGLGLLDLLEAKICQSLKNINWQRYISTLSLEKNRKLHLMSSGEPTQNYAGRVLDFNWEIFFEEYDGSNFIEYLRNFWKEEFDFVFVDSRTGITDSGGICTIQIPDVLAIVFTANYQSLYGAKE